MSEKSNEEKLKLLEEKINSLEHEIERLQAVHEIQNLMGRYEAIHNPTDMHKSWELWAQHTSGTSFEVSDWGRIEGIEGIKEFWTTLDFSKDTDQPAVGSMFEHDLTTPIIEVAKDAKTAKAVWFSPGHETVIRDGKLQGLWVWGKYAIDFVKEDGEWKIWHFKWFRTFRTPFYTSWVDRPRSPEFVGPPKHGEVKKKPSTYHKPYFPDSIQVSIPPAPKPYQTWTDEDEGWHLRPVEHP